MCRDEVVACCCMLHVESAYMIPFSISLSPTFPPSPSWPTAEPPYSLQSTNIIWNWSCSAFSFQKKVVPWGWNLNLYRTGSNWSIILSHYQFHNVMSQCLDMEPNFWNGKCSNVSDLGKFVLTLLRQELTIELDCFFSLSKILLKIVKWIDMKLDR